MSTETIDKIRKAATINALKHDGRADAQAVLGSLLGENAELRPRAKQLIPLVQAIVQEVNATPLEQLRAAAEKWPGELAKPRVEEEKKLPPLPNVQKYSRIVTRFAPNPDFVLHIGNSRAAILSHDYARMYGGKFIVRFEDTDPRLKKAQLKYYGLIEEDLKWLGCQWDEECIQSDRITIYYEVAQKLLEKGAAYVCECPRERFRELIVGGRACPDRAISLAEQKKRWERMLAGKYREEGAVFRVKTDLEHPNPAVRDWPAFRIVDTVQSPHPRAGSEFTVWPLYNMASGVDDHDLGITHVIRGKEHLTNMVRQLFLYQHMNWEYPDAIHYGRLKVEGMDLSKSKLMKDLDSGLYAGVDDPRLGTLAALRRRGFSPETIRKLMWDVGPRPVDVTISWDNVYSQNRKVIDTIAHRYYYVSEPMLTKISGVPRDYFVQAPLHPEHPEFGTRTLKVQPHDSNASLYLSKSDESLLKSSQVIRLMGLFNFRLVGISDGDIIGEFLGEPVDETQKTPILQWVPSGDNVAVEVMMPDAVVRKGLGEEAMTREQVGSLIQLVRFGFGRVDKVFPDRVTVYFAHP